MELKNKVVLITGSSSGIGKATALEFARKGARVIVTYQVNKKGGEQVFKECKKLSECALLKLDVTSDKSIKECVKKVVQKFGKINVLVNNAGVISWKNLDKQTDREIENQIKVNLSGLIKATKLFLPHLDKKDSIIINISSGAGKTGYSTLTAYCAAKFAVRGFTQALAEELPSGIKICSVNPGMTSTRMTNYHGVEPEQVADIILRTAEGDIEADSDNDVDVWDYL